MSVMSGRLLLILTSREPYDLTQLASASGASLSETLHHLQRLVDRGFIVAVEADGVAVYRLNPKGVRTEAPPRQRILLIEDDPEVQDLMVTVLEDGGYVLISTEAPADGVSLLKEVAFDLVLTDGFAATSRSVFVSTEDILIAAGETPVVLFSAHRMDPDEVRAAGFRDLIEKPFDLDRLEQQIRALLTLPEAK